MSTKKLLVILVLIAIVVGVAICRGQRKGNTSDMNPDSTPGTTFFSGLGGGGDTLEITRFVGCHRDGRILSFTGICDARIMPGKARLSRFVLKAFSNSVRACYGFSPEDIPKCEKESRDHDRPLGSAVKAKGESRFVVAKDGAFLRLYCVLINAVCTVTVE